MPAAGALIGAIWIIAEPAHAQSAWRFDRATTEISFTTRRFGSPVATGRFGRYDGTFTLDFDQPEKSRVRVTIETASLQAGSSMMDNFIKGRSMLDVASYPTASFTSASVRRIGERSLEIRGQLTIRAITRPITVTAVLDGDPDQARRGERLPFHVHGTFMRPGFDLGRDVNVVDDQVDLSIRGQISR